MRAYRVPLAVLLGTTGIYGELSVTITNGTVVGNRCSASDAIQFQSIPFALPPTGNLRFAPPQSYNATFNGIYEATTAAPNCLQFGTTSHPGPQSEDCLYLDIWTPGNATSLSELPVKVWVYGGFNLYGGITYPLYNGCNLASDAVVVSINYRVGPLGWLALPSAVIQGNMGLQDILLGLAWVQENIKAFGGNADEVVVFGQSAGATDVFAISTLPQAPTLMRAAVLESGGGRYFPTVAEYQPYMIDYVKKLGCGTTDLACIRSKSGSELNQTMIDSPDNVAFNTPPHAAFAATPPNNDSPSPLIDGSIVPAQPVEVGSRVPAIYGSNAQDSSVFVLEAYGSAEIENLTMQDYNVFLVENFGDAASIVNQTYPVSAFASTPLPFFYAMTTIATDSAFKCPAYRALVSTANNGVPVWTYLFNHTDTCSTSFPPVGKKTLELLGPTHGSEIGMVFSNLDHFPLPDGNCSLDSAERQMSADLVAAWTGMAQNGSPGGKIEWPRFYPNESLGITVEASVITAGTVNYSICAQFWDPLNEAILKNVSQSSSGLFNPTTSLISASTATGSTSFPSPTKGSATTVESHLVPKMMCLGAFLALVKLLDL